MRIDIPDGTVKESSVEAGKRSVELDERELSTVLAALRLWQLTKSYRQDLDDIATNDNTVFAMDENEIDTLCQRLNCGE